MRCFFVTCALLAACGDGPDPILTLLRSADANDRFEAVVRLGGMAPSKRSQEDLAAAIEDKDAAVRLLAAIALVADDDTGALTAAPEAPQILTPNPSTAPREILELHEQLVFKDPWFAGTLLPAILVAARDKDERVRELALRALRVLGPKAPIDFRAVIARATKND